MVEEQMRTWQNLIPAVHCFGQHITEELQATKDLDVLQMPVGIFIYPEKQTHLQVYQLQDHIKV
jgi:hypothetical protein